jgi:hypothetical protein
MISIQVIDLIAVAEKCEKKLNKKKLKEELTNNLLNYIFPDDPFEPSSDKPIEKENLTVKNLAVYHADKYYTADKPSIHRKKIENIIGASEAEYFIKLNKSEYFKVLTHFMILTIVKNGWDKLLSVSSTTISKPSLSNNPLANGDNKTKKENDDIIRCFYSRLLEGMTKQDKERYQILLPYNYGPSSFYSTGFDELLIRLDIAFQKLFSFEKKILDDDDESLLPDANLAEALIKTIVPLIHYLKLNVKPSSCREDTLRAMLIKCSSINRAINDIDAIFNLQNYIIQDLPKNIDHLPFIVSESEILHAIANIFNTQESNLPNDLLECAKLVCLMYIEGSPPPTKIDEFVWCHVQPFNIAVSAVLLFHDYLQEKKLILNIRGETNPPNINVYKKLSELANKKDSSKILTEEILNKYEFPDELNKYLTTRYAVTAFGLSLSKRYPLQKGAEAHLKVRRVKWEILKIMYKAIKTISINDANLRINDFCLYVDQTIHTTNRLPK